MFTNYNYCLVTLLFQACLPLENPFLSKLKLSPATTNFSVCIILSNRSIKMASQSKNLKNYLKTEQTLLNMHFSSVFLIIFFCKTLFQILLLCTGNSIKFLLVDIWALEVKFLFSSYILLFYSILTVFSKQEMQHVFIAIIVLELDLISTGFISSMF